MFDPVSHQERHDMDEPHPTLPQGYSKTDVIAVLSEVAGALGLGRAAKDTLIRMVGATDRSHWQTTDATPVFFGSQQALARDLGLSARQVRNHERRFEALGLIRRDVKANGARDGRSRLGIAFAPLIEIFTDLMQLRDARRAEAARIRELAGLRSTRLRRVKASLARLPHDALKNAGVGEIIEEFQQWPRSDRLFSMPLDSLERHLEACRKLCERLEGFASIHDDISGQPDADFRCLLQENNEDPSSGICNDIVVMQSAGKPAQDNELSSEPYGSEGRECDGAKGDGSHNPQILRHVRPSVIFDLASLDFQARAGGNRRPVTWGHLIDAAHGMLAPLGINHSAWDDACDVMGLEAAATSILIIDINRTHPTKPIRSPGGTLRRLTSAARSGELNLVGSLKGIERRMTLGEMRRR